MIGHIIWRKMKKEKKRTVIRALAFLGHTILGGMKVSGSFHMYE